MILGETSRGAEDSVTDKSSSEKIFRSWRSLLQDSWILPSVVGHALEFSNNSVSVPVQSAGNAHELSV